MGASNVICRVVSAGTQQLEPRAFRGCVEVVTMSTDGSVFNDVLHCNHLRETEAEAYADGIALKDRLEITEMIRDIALD